jgi:Domain of unknown function (DUF4389)
MDAYPLTFDVTSPEGPRNRLTSAFRIILAIPHLLIVGGPGVGWGANSNTGVFGGVAAVVSVIAWFAILFTGRFPRGLWDLSHMYVRWRARAIAYMALLRDEYPPFGDDAYPVDFQLDYPDVRNRWTVAFRLILAIPQMIVFFFVGLAGLIAAVIGWFAILFTGRYPEGLWEFGVGVQRWSLRLQAYLLLLRDEYPPFSLSA